MIMVAGFASVLAALVFGFVAIRHWRLRDASIIDGLGLRWRRGSAADMMAGTTIAALAMVLIFGAEWSLGAIAPGAAVVHAAPSIVKAALIMMGAVLLEEFLNRALLLSGLTIALRGRAGLAIALSSIVFGMSHLANHGASALSVMGNMMGGVIYGLAFVLSARLWLPVALHFAWNFMQGPVLGFPVSGFDMGGLQQVRDIGPVWLTGGAYGPEGGVVGLLFRFLVIALVVLYLRSARREGRVSAYAPLHAS
jgi:membrane protease YdiL (CAAX protease family)